MVLTTDWYTGFGSRAFITARLKTFIPKNSPSDTSEKLRGSEAGL